jgi:hypothetical protein
MARPTQHGAPTRCVRDTSNTTNSDRIFGKRTPPPNPSSYAKDRFVLTWKPGDYTANIRNRVCSDAYAAIKPSCGHAGNLQNNLAASTTIGVRCGTYSSAVVSLATLRGYKGEERRRDMYSRRGVRHFYWR